VIIAHLEAQRDKHDLRAIEKSLFELFRGQSDEGVTFDRLSELTEQKYPLLAYLFFLKDMDRFTPIQPTGFDRAFRELGVDLVTLRNCSWENYSHYNGVLGEVRVALEQVAGLKNVRLIDAHSFCWILSTLLRREAQGLEQGHQRADSGRVVGARERCIVDMKYSIIQAVQQARGQVVVRSVEMKIKNLGFDEYALEKHLKELMKMQGDKCALTGIPFQFDGEDSSLLPSPDRIDSQGHYDHGNIQIVCRFINFWKGDAANEEFLRLLALVRGRSEEGIGPDEDDDLSLN
jgi:hypothetical protein